MRQLRLWFQSSKSMELTKSEFSTPERLHVCIRGKQAVKELSNGSFQWTSAVQAFSVLAIRSKLGEIDGGTVCSIEGEGGSFASSLAYALAKKPIWLQDMFGSLADGSLVAQRLISRVNPEQRQAGPVTLLINRRFLDLIEIFLDGEECKDTRRLQGLLSKLDTRSPTDSSVGSAHRPRSPTTGQDIPGASTTRSSLLFDRFECELARSLTATDIFNRWRLIRSIRQITQDPIFERLSGRERSICHDLHFQLVGRDRLAIVADSLQIEKALGGRPLVVALPATLLAATMVFEWLKATKKTPMVVDTSYALGRELEGRMGMEFADLVVLPMISAARYLGTKKPEQREFIPFSIMPSGSQRIVASHKGQRRATLNSGIYLMMQDNIETTATAYVQELKRGGVLSSSRFGTEHVEPDEVFEMMGSSDEDLKAVLWFPHYIFHEVFNGSACLDDPAFSSVTEHAILFIHRRWIRDHSFLLNLNIALRDAWLDVRNDSRSRQAILRRIFRDDSYSRVIYRSGGLATSSRRIPSDIFAHAAENLQNA